MSNDLTEIEEGIPAEFAGTSSMAMAIWFNPAVFAKAQLIATYLSKAVGMVPEHLIGKPETCFAVVERSLTWKLSPFAVAQSTYSPGGGKIGYEGKLCQAILESSGRIVGGVQFEHYGDWSRIQGKFKKLKSDKGKEFAAPAWAEADEKGLGVRVFAQIKGEANPRSINFDLVQAFPRNSTLWATDPKTQICYTAVRRFSSVAAPALFLGVPFDDDIPQMRDITPERPTRAARRAASEPEPESIITDAEIITDADEVRGDKIAAILAAIAAAENQVQLTEVWQEADDDVAEIMAVEEAYKARREELAARTKAKAAQTVAPSHVPSPTKPPHDPATGEIKPTSVQTVKELAEEAARAGKTGNDNPYKEGTTLHEVWRKAFASATRAIAKADEAAREATAPPAATPAPSMAPEPSAAPVAQDGPESASGADPHIAGMDAAETTKELIAFWHSLPADIQEQDQYWNHHQKRATELRAAKK